MAGREVKGGYRFLCFSSCTHELDRWPTAVAQGEELAAYKCNAMQTHRESRQTHTHTYTYTHKHTHTHTHSRGTHTFYNYSEY